MDRSLNLLLLYLKRLKVGTYQCPQDLIHNSPPSTSNKHNQILIPQFITVTILFITNAYIIWPHTNIVTSVLLIHKSLPVVASLVAMVDNVSVRPSVRVDCWVAYICAYYHSQSLHIPPESCLVAG